MGCTDRRTEGTGRGENADPDYFGRDTGDASKDDPRNQDDIGENELLVVSFGTSFNDSRVADIKGIEDAIAAANPDWSVRSGAGRGLSSARSAFFQISGRQFAYLVCLHHASPPFSLSGAVSSLVTIFVLMGSLWLARRSAARATSSETPAISNITRPGFTTATQYSGNLYRNPFGFQRASG